MKGVAWSSSCGDAVDETTSLDDHSSASDESESLDSSPISLTFQMTRRGSLESSLEPPAGIGCYSVSRWAFAIAWISSRSTLKPIVESVVASPISTVAGRAVSSRSRIRPSSSLRP